MVRTRLPDAPESDWGAWLGEADLDMIDPRSSTQAAAGPCLSGGGATMRPNGRRCSAAILSFARFYPTWAPHTFATDGPTFENHAQRACAEEIRIVRSNCNRRTATELWPELSDCNVEE